MAAVEWESGEELIVELPFVRHSKKDGVLYLTNQRMAWAEYSAKEFKFQCGYSNMKSQRISPETSSKVQLQIVLYDGSTATFHFTNISADGIALQERNTVKDMLAKFIQHHKPKPNKELEEKTKLLNSDPSLYQLYKDIVVSGILTAEEFWANKQTVTKTSSDEQKTGISPATMAELQPQVNGANAVKYTLTPEIMRAIFKTYPAVERIHAENVPDKMSEEDFWRQFFDSHYFHCDRMRGTGSSKRKADLISQSAEKDETEQLAESLKECINPLLDLTVQSTEVETYEGYGTGLFPSLVSSSSHPPPSSSSSTSGSKSLIRRFNHQSMMILKSRTKDQVTSTELETGNAEKKAKLLRETVENSELARVTESSVVGLTISNSERYCHGPTIVQTTDSGSDAAEGRHHALEAFQQQLSQWNANLSNVMSSEDACHALANLSPGGVLNPAQHAGGTQYVAGASVEELVKRQHCALAELLRHFWMCFPATSKFLEEKAARMAACLQSFRDSKMMEFKEKLPVEHHQLSEHLDDMLQAALDKYSTWQARKLANKSRTQKPS